MDDLTLRGNASYELPNHTSKCQVWGDCEVVVFRFPTDISNSKSRRR